MDSFKRIWNRTDVFLVNKHQIGKKSGKKITQKEGFRIVMHKKRARRYKGKNNNGKKSYDDCLLTDMLTMMFSLQLNYKNTVFFWSKLVMSGRDCKSNSSLRKCMIVQRK